MIWLRYVPHRDILIYLAKGWKISDEMHNTPHGFYSVLMFIECESYPT